jgi:hypothetical protein
VRVRVHSQVGERGEIKSGVVSDNGAKLGQFEQVNLFLAGSPGREYGATTNPKRAEANRESREFGASNSSHYLQC